MSHGFGAGQVVENVGDYTIRPFYFIVQFWYENIYRHGI
jgi:hypothetical protein